jgi:toxin secretion/phage lysis holin
MKETGFVGILTGVIAYIIGRMTLVTIVLFLFMGIDFITGFLGSRAADEKYDAKKAEKGVYKKMGYLIFWIVAVLVELVLKEQGASIGIAMNMPLVTIVVTFWLLGTEGLSIVNNLHKMGVKVPKWFKSYFEKMKQIKEDDENVN